MTGRRTESGLTLVELMVALTIAAMLALAVATPLRQAIESRDRSEAVLARLGAVRAAISRIADELAGVVAVRTVPAGDPRAPGARFLLQERAIDLPSSDLSFPTSAARPMSEGPRDPIEIVRWRLERAEDPARGWLLVKGQRPSLEDASGPWTDVVVLDRVSRFSACVLPPGPAPAGSGASRPQLPRAVEIELAVDDGTATPPALRVLVPLPIQQGEPGAPRTTSGCVAAWDSATGAPPP